jgi:gliding motility-associated-like protein
MDIISSDTLCEKRTGDQIVLVPDARGDVQYFWNTGATSTSLTVDTAGVYSVTATNENQCWAKGTVTIVNDCGCNLYLPNAFTPDQDGLNDVFFAYGAPPILFEMYIYDRWGVEMYYSDDITKGWDGTYQGVPVKSDVYTVKVICPDNGDYLGRVTLLR